MQGVEDRGSDPIQKLLYPARGSVNVEGQVSEHTSCRSCGYNLFRLPGNGRCPECGAPVGISATGDLIRNSPPGWIRHVARCTRGSAQANSAMLFCAVLLTFRATRPAAVIAMVLMLVFWAAAVWQSVAPEPAEQKLKRSQFLARVGCAVVAGLAGVGGACAAAEVLDAETFTVMLFGAWAGYALAGACQLRCLSALMYRAPSTELAWRVGMRAKTFAFWHVTSGICVAAEMGGSATCCLGLVSILGMAYVTIGATVYQMRTAEMLTLEAEVAEDNWRYHEQVSEPRRRAP